MKIGILTASIIPLGILLGGCPGDPENPMLNNARNLLTERATNGALRVSLEHPNYTSLQACNLAATNDIPYASDLFAKVPAGEGDPSYKYSSYELNKTIDKCVARINALKTKKQALNSTSLTKFAQKELKFLAKA